MEDATDVVDGVVKTGLDPEKIMERFDTLIEKNQPERGGSFYL